MSKTRCGFVAIVGRANVGKSTLFNTILKEELSITTHKPQTTRHNIRGVLTRKHCQLILIDTPGVQIGNKRLINKVLINNVISALQEVDVILMLVDLDRWNDEDEYLLEHIKHSASQVILAVNKIDKAKDKTVLLPILDKMKEKYSFKSIVPLSALQATNVDTLIDELCHSVSESDFLFPEDSVWERDDNFIVSEVVRSAAIMHLQKELPYAIYTEVEKIQFDKGLVTISVIIWVEKPSQKPIVIGKKGAKIKAIGEYARIRLEKIFTNKVMLKTWVKVKENWQDKQDIVAQFEN